jgi:hypothetical protein
MGGKGFVSVIENSNGIFWTENLGELLCGAVI